MRTKKLFIVIYNCFFSLATFFGVQVYSSTEEWYVGDKVSGEINIQLIIFPIDENTVKISIRKEITPFSQALDITTVAERESDKYIFSCLDGWENEIFGYFYIKTDQAILFIGCKKFSDLGKNLARLYGDTTILNKIPEGEGATN